MTVWLVTVTAISLIAYEATDTARVVMQWLHSTLLETGITSIPDLEVPSEKVLGELKAPEDASILPDNTPKSEKDGADNARPIRVALYVAILVIAFWVWGGGPWGF